MINVCVGFIVCIGNEMFGCECWVVVIIVGDVYIVE